MAASPAGVAVPRRQSLVASEFLATLDEQRVFRTEQLAEIDGQPGDGASEAPGTASDEVTRALRDGATRALKEINAAIGRIAEGTYGLCDSCGGDIPVERLEVLPMASLCMRCAHRRDRLSRA